MNKNATDKKRVSFGINKILKNKWTRVCAILLVVSLCASFFIFSFEESVTYAAGPVLWGDKDKDKITTVGSTEVARFYDGTDGTLPAEYDNSAWGKYVLGGINRVDEDHLPINHPSGIYGVGVMDNYIKYYSQNVSILRYGKKNSNSGTSTESEKHNDSHLGISVNSEKIGYVKMEINCENTGRYLYYSISTKSLSNAVGKYFGTFAVDVESSNEIIARTEKNSAGGVASVGEKDYFTNESNISNWVTGCEYGCIDLKAITGEQANSVYNVYLFGGSKTKVLLNYLILSNTPPTKIDVANGNIPDVEVNGGKKGVTREYSDKDGINGTAKMKLEKADSFYFENLVVDTKYTPYLYYSFEVTDEVSDEVTDEVSKKNPLIAMFHYKITDPTDSTSPTYSTYSYGQKPGNKAVKISVTGCVKISSVTGKTGLVNLASADEFAKGFCFSGGANIEIKINYLFLYSGVDITEGSHIIVKNAHAMDISNSCTLDDFNNGSFPEEYAYKNKVNPKDSNEENTEDPNKKNTEYPKGVWAPFEFEINSNLPVKCSWYANSTNEMLNAVCVNDIYKDNIEETDASVMNQKVSVGLAVTIEETIEKKTGEGEDAEEYTSLKTELKLHNPDKRHSGLYFFCLVVSDKDYEFPSTILDKDIANLNRGGNLVSNYCRLDVANNLVYHKVDKSGKECGIIEEHWLIYGTDYKITNNADFAEKGGYLTYNSYTAATATTKSEYKRDEADICDKEYKLIETYDYANVEQGASEVTHDGWILFEETIKNQFCITSFDAYKSKYSAAYPGRGYDAKDTHPSWTFDQDENFKLDGEPEDILHDTTLNFYTKWKIPVDVEKLEANIFVDEFGTVFRAVNIRDNEIDYGYDVLQKPNSESIGEFFNEVYIAIAQNDEETTVKISPEKGKMQYSIDEMQTWVDIDDELSKLKGKYSEYDEEADLGKVKDLYGKTSEDLNWVYGLKIETDEFLDSFGKFDKTSGKITLTSNFKIEFKYVTGVSVNDSWFDFTGSAVCCSLNFIPYRYHDLT